MNKVFGPLPQLLMQGPVLHPARLLLVIVVPTPLEIAVVFSNDPLVISVLACAAAPAISMPAAANETDTVRREESTAGNPSTKRTAAEAAQARHASP